jgi:hypothetical protein
MQVCPHLPDRLVFVAICRTRTPAPIPPHERHKKIALQ